MLLLRVLAVSACLSFAVGQKVEESAVSSKTPSSTKEEDAVSVGIFGPKHACDSGSSAIGCSVGGSILASVEMDALLTGKSTSPIHVR